MSGAASAAGCFFALLFVAMAGILPYVRLAFLSTDPSRTREVDDRELIELYRHPRPDRGPVWLRTNFVATLDGSIQGADGRSRSINTPSDNQVFALHRAHADVILVAAGTARAEGYRSVDLAPWQRELRAAEGLAEFPTLAVVSGSLDLDPQIAHPTSGSGGPVMIITHGGWTSGDLRRFTEVGIEVVQVGDDTVDLVAAADRLAAHGLHRVLCEGGPRLHRDLLAADLVDEVSLTLAPVLVGGDGQRTTGGAALASAVGFVPRLIILAEDGTVLTSYLRR